MHPRQIVRIAVVVAALVAVALPAAAQTPARMGDKDVELQMEKVQKGLERFIDGMDRKIKTAILKSESGEIDVKVVLEDLKRSVSEMRDGYKPPSSSGGTQLLACIKKLKDFDAGLAKRPGLSGADTKWADLVPDIARLAGAYGFDFNGDPAGWKVSRASDQEVMSAAQTIRKGAETLAKQVDDLLKKDKSVDAAARASAKATITGLATAAKSLEDALKNKVDSGPAVTRVISARTEIATYLDGTAAVAAAKPAWSRTESTIATLAKAYGIGR